MSGSNGAGKSTMMCALCLALFGRPFRKISKTQLINTINKKDLVVEVEFKIGRKNYLVRRGMKPNKFEIYRNGKLINQDSKNTDYQKMLEQQILKMNYKTFTQVVILGSAKFVPFMQLSAADRRAIIEDLLDIQVFTTMNNLLKSRYAEMKDQIYELETTLRVQNERIVLHKRYVENLNKDKNKSIEKYTRLVAKSDKNISVLQEQVTKIQERVARLQEPLSIRPDLTKRKADFKDIHNKIFLNYKQKVGLVELFEQNEQCPTCLQKLDGQHCDHLVSDHKKAIVEMREGMDKLKGKLDKLEEQFKQLDQIQLKMTTFLNKQQEIQNNITATTTYKQTLLKEIEKLQSESGEKTIQSEVQKLQAAEEKYDKLRQDKDVLIDDRHLYDIVAMLLRDSGIKTKIISQYLPVMNQMINKYLNMLDFSISFELNENFDETIKSRYRDDFTYNSFSEGEKQRIDLALLFAWRDIAKMRNSANTNLLILDEVFDSSLDTGGTEEFMKLLKTLNDKTNTFIITHHGDALYDKFNASIKFSKTNNFSTMTTEGID